MLRLLFLAALLQCTISQQYQQKVAPGVPPQNYQNYQQPPPPPPPQQQQYQQQQQQQFQPPPPQQQQYQPPPPPPQQQQQQFQQQQPPQQQFQQQQQHGHAHHGDPQLLNPANIAQERDHIQEHMEVPIDTSKMSEQELQFHYFKMHDADNNNKLDGCELIKSLIHWHGQVDKNHQSYTDEQLEQLLEHVFKHTDINKDGYIDYLEYRISDYKAKKAEKEKEASGAR
ncbi:vacuolar protein-sorting-associated protein 36 isoform X2 [Helicoverpa zea]|uniref:vacuolar protein-sorting-associated protein 36 isoform X2 n=1 Tax=Helicoverpa zea TaxID=7113 RepID=UPI001F58D121|nr:vacuolar protein-sorting-associated protein 36 isoform X2 [Helicoverpa zea]